MGGRGFMQGVGLFLYYLCFPWGVLGIISWYFASGLWVWCSSPGTSSMQLTGVVVAKRHIPQNARLTKDDVEVSFERLKAGSGGDEFVRIPGRVVGHFINEDIDRGKKIRIAAVKPLADPQARFSKLQEGPIAKVAAMVISQNDAVGLEPGRYVYVARVNDGTSSVIYIEGCEAALTKPVKVLDVVGLPDNEKKAALLFEWSGIEDKCFKSFTSGHLIPFPVPNSPKIFKIPFLWTPG